MAIDLLSNSALSNIDNTGNTPTAANRIPNPLRNHNHYNYIITLGILSINEINNPQSYRNGGFQKIIFRSGGGQYDIRQRVFLEDSEHAEYFVENLNIDALIAPNERTGIALGTTVSFEVIEPYSMGKFIESMIAAAGSVGYNSFNNAPYCLKIEFVGWDEYGTNNVNYVEQPYYLPITITNVEFNVKESGCVYQVQAVPYSEIALSRHIDTTTTEIRATGKTVHEVLETGELSVTHTINQNIDNIEENSTLSSYDKYVILFPQSQTTIMEAISAGVIANQLSTIPASPDDFIRVSTRVNSEIYQVLRSLAQDTSQMNELGLSEIDIDPTSGSTMPAALPQEIYDDSILRVARRNASTASPTIRDFTFRQDSRITEIIETILQASVAVREEASRILGSESPRMYRIETYTFAVDNPPLERLIGRSPRVYVYAVHPYISDQSHYLAPNQRPATTAQLRQNAVKEYNYFYTGKNEDIINFDINYRYAFLQAAYADFGQLVAGERVQAQTSSAVGPQTESVEPPEVDLTTVTTANGSLVRIGDFPRSTNGSQVYDSTAQLASMMHNIFINSNIDLINAEMKIWGDPYYLPTILGNYSPASTSTMLTADSTINYLRNDVMIIVNFLNPLDYDIKGSTMSFNDQLNPAFSGVYQVIGVTNQFSRGQYTQDIKMLRQRGQELETGSAQRYLVKSSRSSGLNSLRPTVSRGATTGNTRQGSNSNPAALLSDNGTIADTRTGIWSNEAIDNSVGAAAGITTILSNPITRLSDLGRLLSTVPTSLQSVLPNIRINTTLTPRPPG